MTGKEAYDIALKIAEAAMRNLQFFIAICTAFGGWVLAGDTIKEFDKFSVERILMAMVFTIATSGIIYGEISILKRMNAALDVSRSIFEEENNGLTDAMVRLHYLPGTRIPALAMIGTVFFIDALIFFS